MFENGQAFARRVAVRRDPDLFAGQSSVDLQHLRELVPDREPSHRGSPPRLRGPCQLPASLWPRRRWKLIQGLPSGKINSQKFFISLFLNSHKLSELFIVYYLPRRPFKLKKCNSCYTGGFGVKQAKNVNHQICALVHICCYKLPTAVKCNCFPDDPKFNFKHSNFSSSTWELRPFLPWTWTLSWPRSATTLSNSFSSGWSRRHGGTSNFSSSITKTDTSENFFCQHCKKKEYIVMGS